MTGKGAAARQDAGMPSRPATAALVVAAVAATLGGTLGAYELGADTRPAPLAETATCGAVRGVDRVAGRVLAARGGPDEGLETDQLRKELRKLRETVEVDVDARALGDEVDALEERWRAVEAAGGVQAEPAFGEFVREAAAFEESCAPR